MAQSALEFDPGGRQEARGEQRSDGENGGCIRLAILLFPVNQLLDREVGFIIILFPLFFSCLPTRAPCWSVVFFFCAGGCLSTWHGVGGFTANSPSSPLVVFFTVA